MFHGNKLIELMDGRKNNLDFIRFVTAVMVIFSHSFPLSTGDNTFEPFVVFTQGQTTLGHVAVCVFFVTSGFLITQSFERSKSLIIYFRARVLRIFPALIFVVLLSAFFLGPLVTSLSIKEYLLNINTYTYLTNVFLHPINPYLPGVFETNIYKNAINGSLWTLQYEFLFYITVAIFGVCRILKPRFILPLFIFFSILSFFKLPFGETISYIPELFSFFLAGMSIYLLREKLVINLYFVSLSIVLLIVSSKLGGFIHMFMIAGSILIFYLAYNKNINLYNFSKYGDFSYGIYIYAFPVQQLITYINGGTMEYYTNFLYSFPIILLFSFLSWHLIEKKALNLKKPRNNKDEITNNSLQAS